MKKEKVYEVLEKAYFSENRHEDEELKLLSELLSEGGCELFIDVGASLGQYTKEACEILKGKKIISIEADPIRFDRLTELTSQWQNNGNQNTLIPLHCAAGDFEGKIDFYTDSSNTSGSLTPVSGRVTTEESVLVDVKKIDSLVPSNKENVFVKIDVEGSEYRVLKGMESLLQNTNIEVLVELHAWGDTTVQKYPHHVLSYLKGFGFMCYKTHAHYLFTKTSKNLEHINISSEIIRHYIKHILWKIPALRWIKYKIFG